MKRSRTHSGSYGSPVQVDTISKHYGSLAAVDGVSIDVAAGEFLSLLGPSGSGKTTLLMMIAGFERPSGGAISIDGHDYTHVAPNKRGVGMVFQKYALFPHMTIRDNIAFPLKMRRLNRNQIGQKVDEALALVRLEDYGDRLPRQLSGGQQQRIAVARALVFEPPVLLMDEPLGALDKKLREQMQIEIKSIQERLGVTVIYVTHDQEEALTMSDRVAVMNNGQLAQIGTPIKLYQSPATPFVADFIGKMNFVEADFIGADIDHMHLRITEDMVVQLPLGPNRIRPEDQPAGRVKLALRPERLILAPKGEGGPSVISGTVTATIFVGAFRVFLVSIGEADAEPLYVQLPIADSPPFERGDAVDVVLTSDGFQWFEENGK